MPSSSTESTQVSCVHGVEQRGEVEVERLCVNSVLSACPGPDPRALIATGPLVSLADIKARGVASRHNEAPCSGHRFSAPINRWLADQWLARAWFPVLRIFSPGPNNDTRLGWLVLLLLPSSTFRPHLRSSFPSRLPSPSLCKLFW